MASQIITQNQVKDLFEYRNGELFWKIKPAQRVKIDSKAGSLHQKGYLQTEINGKKYLNHRIIFLMFHGYLPEFIDHIDNNRSNNRIENLREATLSQNQHNAKTRKDNTSGVKGVCWYKATQKWRVQLQVNGKVKFFGDYNDLEVAKLVANEARNTYHQNYANHG